MMNPHNHNYTTNDTSEFIKTAVRAAEGIVLEYFLLGRKNILMFLSLQSALSI